MCTSAYICAAVYFYGSWYDESLSFIKRWYPLLGPGVFGQRLFENTSSGLWNLNNKIWFHNAIMLLLLLIGIIQWTSQFYLEGRGYLFQAVFVRSRVDFAKINNFQRARVPKDHWTSCSLTYIDTRLSEFEALISAYLPKQAICRDSDCLLARQIVFHGTVDNLWSVTKVHDDDYICIS